MLRTTNGERSTVNGLVFRQLPGGFHHLRGVRQERRFERGAVGYGRIERCDARHGRVEVLEGFFGNRRYDKILTELSIAPNILTDRLSRLVANGVLHRRQYQSSPDRYEYLLTDMGRDLYGPFIAMLGWGDRWLAKGKPPLLLKHLSCGHDFRAEVVCDHCKQPALWETDYKFFGENQPRGSNPEQVCDTHAKQFAAKWPDAKFPVQAPN